MTETITYQTDQRVCSKSIYVAMRDDVIIEARFTGGCSGNTSGICSLVKGMNAEKVVRLLKNIDCGGRGTSCPDQLARAIEQMIDDREHI